MKRTVGALVLLAAGVAGYQVVGLASGSAVPSAPASSSSPTPSRSPEEMAIGSYNSGIDHKDKGLKLEASARYSRASGKPGLSASAFSYISSALV